MECSIIDTHALIVSGDIERYPMAPLGGQQSAWSTERAATVEQMLAAMNDAGIARTVLLQSSTAYGFDNSYVADAVASHRDRFCGVFSVNVLADTAAREMRDWHRRGLIGMRIFAHGSTMSEAWLAIDDPRTYRAWDCAADLGISVSTNAAKLAEVESILRRYPQVPLILEHVARPEIPEGPPYDGVRDLLTLSKYGNLYLKVTPRTFVAARRGHATPESYVEKLIAEFGSERLLWGSYYPPTPMNLTEIVADVKTVLSPFAARDRNNILWQTANRLFGSAVTAPL